MGAFIVNRGVSFPLDVWNRIKYRTQPRRSRGHRLRADPGRDRRERPAAARRRSSSSTPGPMSTSSIRNAGTRPRFAAKKESRTTPSSSRRSACATWKGWKELIDAVASILPTHPHAHLALIGCRDESERAEVSELCATSAASATHVTPVEYRDDMPNVFASLRSRRRRVVGRHRHHRHDPRGDGDAKTGHRHRLRRQPRAGLIARCRLADSGEGSAAAGARDRGGDRRSRAARARGRERARSMWCAVFRKSCGSRGWRRCTSRCFE